MKCSVFANSFVFAVVIMLLSDSPLEAQESDRIEEIRRALKDITSDVPAVLVPAAGLLQCIGPADREAIPIFVRTLTNARNHAVPRIRSAIALGSIHADPEVVVPALKSVLLDQNAELRHVAADALGRFGTDAKPAATSLRKLLKDEHANVRVAAASSLILMDESIQDSVKTLAVATRDENYHLRWMACEGLSSVAPMPGPDVEAALLQVADNDDEHPDLREFARYVVDWICEVETDKE
ncbi:MAG: HEAT repeat domain-containing protein [Planctomycetota bacterium]